MVFVPEFDEPKFDEPELLDMEEPDDYVMVDELDFTNNNAFDTRLHSAPASNTEDSEADAMFEAISIPSYQDKKENGEQHKKTIKKEEPKAQKETVNSNINKEQVKEVPQETSATRDNKKNPEPQQADTQKNETTKQPEVKEVPITNVNESASIKTTNNFEADLEDTDVEDCTFNFGSGDVPDIEPDIESEEAIITDPEGNIYISTFSEVTINDDDPSDTFDNFEDLEGNTDKGTEENTVVKFLSIKKIISVAAMLIVIIGIPFLMDLVGNKEEKELNQYTVTVTTVESTEAVSSINSSSVFEKTEKEVFEASSSETAISTRFETLDDLTLYLSSNLGSTLSSEKQLVTQLNNGTISYDTFIAQMNEHIVFTDNLNHLLIANKETYRNAGLEDTYNELVANSNALIVYGDKALYEAGIEQQTTAFK